MTWDSQVRPGFLSNDETHARLNYDGATPSANDQFARHAILGTNTALHDLRMDVGTLSIDDDFALSSSMIEYAQKELCCINDRR